MPVSGAAPTVVASKAVGAGAIEVSCGGDQPGPASVVSCRVAVQEEAEDLAPTA
jgi:hypothetical protein